MSQKNFKQIFLDNVLDFLWSQWSAIGVAGGGVRAEDEWAIDPEALLVFSLPFARFEPRLFDEILGWLVNNGKWVDIQRLKGILKSKDELTKRLLSAVALNISLFPHSYPRKWQVLGRLYKKNGSQSQESLFLTKDGEPYPKSETKSEAFYAFGFLRESFALRRMSQSIAISKNCNIRFLLRALFGIGSRSECILYLLTHEAGHPSEIAGAIGISTKATQDTLVELAESGLVLTRVKGKRKIEYWLSAKRWWEFIKNEPLSEIKPPIWINWIAVFNALSEVWRVLIEVEVKETSDYMKSSKLHEAMEQYIGREFERSGLSIPDIPGRGIAIEEYAQRFEEFIKKVLGVK